MAAEVVHDDDVATPYGGHQKFADPRQETDGVCRPVEHTGRDDAIAPQTGHENQRPSMSMRHLCHQTLTRRAATVLARHIRRRPCLVNKDQPGSIDLPLQRLPYLTTPGNIGTVLFTGAQSFF